MLKANKKTIFFLFLLAVTTETYSQNKEELKQTKRALEKEIEFTHKLLNKTKEKKNTSLNYLKVLTKRIDNQKKLSTTFSKEIKLTSKEISKIEEKILTIEEKIKNKNNDLELLKREYEKMIYSAHINKLNRSDLIFIISSESFNQAYKRINYLKQYSSFRKKQAQNIRHKQKDLQDSRKQLIIDKEILFKKQVEKKRVVREKSQLITDLRFEEKAKEEIVGSLILSENKFKKELEKKEKLKKLLNQKIRKIIEEEIKKARKKHRSNGSQTEFSLTPEAKELSEEFESNKGKLPWPLSKGIVVQSYGKQQHDVFKTVETFNNGVDIATEKNAPIRSVFDGHISRIFFIKGEGKAILINHGEYFTVYSGLKEISVKVGEKIFAKEKIGVVITQESDNKTELHFEIWKGYEKQDPSKWLFNVY
jgi:septal ring factor EnvC (AmiA/AmiB activator)